MVAERIKAIEGEGAHVVVVDGRPCPPWGAGSPLLASCVDNGSALCYDEAESLRMERACCAILDALQLRYRVVASCLAEWTLVGVVLNAQTMVVRSKPSRMWRLRTAICDMVEQGRVSP